ncbi:MAG TPA: ATP-binding cassette domain-containing protein [Ornithinimicrobium sp.]|uniref:ABC transporter ATP-binding protein n=1 Tax=Ornithinimicrobium sp. TaxID=1977084 RepID=UPI002B4A8906|nr:ATP-binding cassette domain-containing protein [Ornithinimicrobium sp.]HKJ11695.1 ATP-binding cassette domain-containing protein [Ornithinimicrobium sp.]
MSEPPAIEVRGLGRTFRRARTSWHRPGSAVSAVREVDLTVAAGERFGVVGESGSGKSTLLRMICGLDQPTYGSVQVRGRAVAGQSWRALQWLRGEVGVVFQDPMGSLDPRMRVGEAIAEPLLAQRIGDRSSRADRVRELLVAVGLPPEAARRYPHQFSGGQRQRISIARALAPSPSILVADEPVSALDVSVRAQVLNLLNDVVSRRGLTLVFVSHDLLVVRQVCDRVAVMRRGELVEVGDTARVFADPQHEYTRELLASVPTLPPLR